VRPQGDRRSEGAEFLRDVKAYVEAPALAL
jgi:hypothetical protein